MDKCSEIGVMFWESDVSICGYYYRSSYLETGSVAGWTGWKKVRGLTKTHTHVYICTYMTLLHLTLLDKSSWYEWGTIGKMVKLYIHICVCIYIKHIDTDNSVGIAGREWGWRKREEGKEGGNRDKRLCLEPWVCDALCRWDFIELYSWNLYGFANQGSPDKFKLKRGRKEIASVVEILVQVIQWRSAFRRNPSNSAGEEAIQMHGFRRNVTQT